MYQKITNCKLICFILFALIFLQTAVLAFRAGVPLTIGYTAEHIALSAVTAQASGINAVLYNPAAVIAEEHERNFLSAYNKLPEDVNSYLLVYSNEFKNFNINQQARLSLFLAGLDAGKINQTLIDGRDYILTNNTKKYSALQFGLSSSFKNKNFLYGFNLKNYSENIADYKSSTFLFDAGILIKNFFIDFLDVGVSALNLGGSLKFTNESEKISDVYSVGLKYQIFRFDFLADLKKIGTVAPKLNMGFNFRFDDNLHFMFGYNGIKTIDHSISLGLAYMRDNYGIQYAYDAFSELGALHYITLSFAFKPLMFDVPKREPAKKIADDETKKEKATDIKADTIIQPTTLPEFEILDINALENQGKLALKENNTNLAIKIFELLIKAQPENIEYLKLLGDAYYAKKDFTNAVKYYEQVQKIAEQLMK